jgi:hypothetical protein
LSPHQLQQLLALSPQLLALGGLEMGREAPGRPETQALASLSRNPPTNTNTNNSKQKQKQKHNTQIRQLQYAWLVHLDISSGDITGDSFILFP